jgi:hypothetical protein
MDDKVHRWEAELFVVGSGVGAAIIAATVKEQAQ